MKRILMLIVAAMLAASQVQAADDAIPVPPVPVPKAKPPEAFGDWSKKCETSPEGTEICYIVQTATNKENGRMVMQVRVGFPPGKAEPIMIATVPLSVLLPPGAAYFMDDKELLKLPFLACDIAGCTTGGIQLSKEVIDKMRKGKQGQVRVALINRQILPLPVSLKGFTRAFNSIQPKK